MNSYRNCKKCKTSFRYYNMYDFYCSHKCDFLDKFDPQDQASCWNWLGRFDIHGYGQFAANVFAHRYSYEFYKEPIPQGLLIRHSCNNRACVNPNHLMAGTHKENMADAVLAGSYKGERNAAAVLTNEQVLEIYKSTDGTYALARKYGVSASAICDIKFGRSWQHVTHADGNAARATSPKGEKHHNNKLSTADVLAIYESTERNKDLVKKYNVKPATICDIKHGRIWAHLTNHKRN